MNVDVRNRLLAALIAVALLPCVARADPPQSLEEALAAVSGDARVLGSMLPNLVCTERITSRRIEERNRVEKQVSMVFERPTQAWEDASGPPFVVTRELPTPGGADPDTPGLLQVGPGFGSVLLLTFSPENLSDQEFRIDARESERTGEIVVRFATRPGQETLRFDANGESYPFRGEGTAWIEPETLRVRRIERSFRNHPEFEELSVGVDYGEVVIRGEAVWMPRRLDAESRTDTRVGERREAHVIEYHGCRRFGSAIQFQIVEP